MMDREGTSHDGCSLWHLCKGGEVQLALADLHNWPLALLWGLVPSLILVRVSPLILLELLRALPAVVTGFTAVEASVVRDCLSRSRLIEPRCLILLGCLEAVVVVVLLRRANHPTSRLSLRLRRCCGSP